MLRLKTTRNALQYGKSRCRMRLPSRLLAANRPQDLRGWKPKRLLKIKRLKKQCFLKQRQVSQVHDASSTTSPKYWSPCRCWHCLQPSPWHAGAFPVCRCRRFWHLINFVLLLQRHPWQRPDVHRGNIEKHCPTAAGLDSAQFGEVLARQQNKDNSNQ